MPALEWGLAAAGVLGLGWVWRREQRRVGAARGELLAGCAGLVDAPVLARDGLDYPVLRGRRAGCAAEIRPLADTTALRKLPALWLQVTLAGRTGAAGVLDALRRPLGTEHWSPAADLPVSLPAPPELPPDVQVRADHGGVALLPVLRAQAGFLHRPDAKEVLVTPKGVRLVVLLAEADRGSYLLFRDARFAIRRLEPEHLAELLRGAERLMDNARASAARAPVTLDAAA